jgi:EEF1A lysine methyltransferase 4
MMLLILIWAVLSEDMAKDGYKDIVNIDISSVVIEQMREKHKEIPQLTCTVR